MGTREPSFGSLGTMMAFSFIRRMPYQPNACILGIRPGMDGVVDIFIAVYSAFGHACPESRFMPRSVYWEENMEIRSLKQELSSTSYPGRGIILGRTQDGKKAAGAYFIMGRSTNSRNRVFVAEGEGIRTEAYDPSKLEDPSLIIYAPVRVLGRNIIITNGDQTDTIFKGLQEGKSFEESLRERAFEPDAPNYTPRISGLITLKEGSFDYQMSILKSDRGNPENCCRYCYSYDNPVPGEGRFLHTYMGDGNPLPSFEGEPQPVTIEGGIDAFTGLVWNALNEENRVSLFVRFIDLGSGNAETRIVNKNN